MNIHLGHFSNDENQLYLTIGFERWCL